MALARPLCGSPVPTYSFFQNAVLITLARRLNLQPNITVTLDDELRRDVIRAAGIDPDGLPEDWIANRKSKAPAGLDRNISTAYRFLHWHTKGGRHGKAKTVAGKPGQWGLTELGVESAKALLPKPAPKPKRASNPNRNLTAEWLTEHLTPEPGQSESDLHRRIRFTLAKKCRLSASRDMLDDHVNQFVVRLIQRDGLRKKLEAGEKIHYSTIATYAVNSAFTDIRDFGTDPVTREGYGARTPKERQAISEWVEKKAKGDHEPSVGFSHVSSDAVSYSARDDHEGIDPSLFDVVDEPEHPVDRLNFEKVWTRLEDALKASKPNAWERYVGILKMQILEDLPVKEIARREQVSPHRAATMLQEARRAVRDIGRSALLG